MAKQTKDKEKIEKKTNIISVLTDTKPDYTSMLLFQL